MKAMRSPSCASVNDDGYVKNQIARCFHVATAEQSAKESEAVTTRTVAL
jgi:hypothetical protein